MRDYVSGLLQKNSDLAQQILFRQWALPTSSAVPASSRSAGDFSGEISVLQRSRLAEDAAFSVSRSERKEQRVWEKNQIQMEQMMGEFSDMQEISKFFQRDARRFREESL